MIDRDPNPLFVFFRLHKRPHSVAFDRQSAFFSSVSIFFRNLFVFFVDVFLQPGLRDSRDSGYSGQRQLFRQQLIDNLPCFPADCFVCGVFDKLPVEDLALVFPFAVVNRTVFDNFGRFAIGAIGFRILLNGRLNLPSKGYHSSRLASGANFATTC